MLFILYKSHIDKVDEIDLSRQYTHTTHPP